MAKKKLTDQQKKRIQENQQQKIDQSQDNINSDIGQVIAVQRKAAQIKFKSNILKVKIRKTLESIVCGDKVVFEKTESGEQVISAILPRSSVLARNSYKQKLKLIAANIDLVVIVVSLIPEPNYELLDRYLLVCETNQIEPLIVLNKIDLDSNEASILQAQDRLKLYQDIGYTLINTSVKSGFNVNRFENYLMGKLSTLVGQSGVGKSSIIKYLVPDQEILIGQISEKQHGRHTTSASYLYDLEKGGQVIDTPGIRDFALGDFDLSELIQGFIEFKQFIGFCKFSNCTHTNEPNCAIKQAVSDNKISQYRYDNFIKIFSSVSDQKKNY